MRILVTGNLGYVGMVLGNFLSERDLGWNLEGLDAAFFRGSSSDQSASSYKSQKIGDIRNVEVAELVGVDAIVHLAAVSNDPMGKDFESATQAINIDASITLAENAKRAGVKRFVFASSCSVYGAGSDAPRTETDPINPLTAYAISKIRMEEALEKLSAANFQATALRFATACGTSPSIRLDLVMNDFVASCVQNGKIEVLSDGTPWRPLIHTRDMARAVEWALQREGESFLTVNVGSREWTWQIGQLAKDVASVFSGAEVTINTNAAPDKRSYQVDFSQYRRLAPAFQPSESFNQSVLDLQTEIRSLPLNAHFRNSNFIRLNRLRNLRKKGEVDELLFRLA